MQTCTLAVDIGASSGRHIAGTVQNGKITLQEVYRFENGVHRENGHLCWDIDTLAQEVVNGLKAAHDAGFAPATIGIDTWAVDFVLLDADERETASAVSDADGLVRFRFVPQGQYTICETSAPDGYLLNRSAISVTVTPNWTNAEEPIATVVNQQKKIQFIKVDTAGTPMAGILFKLINAETGAVAEMAVSDENGAFAFTAFDYGVWIVHEAAAPSGYSRMADYRFQVDDSWSGTAPVLLVNIPDSYAFMKVDADGKPLQGVKFALRDADGNLLQTLESDENGIIRAEHLQNGTYYLQETETLKGYTLSGDVRKLVIDEHYKIPEEMPQWVNYTTIQTGVQLAASGVMLIGIALMLISGTMLLMRRRRKA